VSATVHQAPDPEARLLPSLGPRGEGWVAGQVVIFLLVVAAGIFAAGWPAWASPWRWVAVALTGAAGLGLAAGAAAGLGRQLTPLPAPVDGAALRDRGAYALCRHPMYGGVLLLCLGWALATSPWALLPVALGAAFLDLKRRVEERWLRERFPGYRVYAARVRCALVPFVW
jgi:protein-S-isoprenylcysteine O-methyltransferase Ste14